MKIHFEHSVRRYAAGTELPCIICAEIGPLQLGVVLVSLLFLFFYLGVHMNVYLFPNFEFCYNKFFFSYPSSILC